MTGEKGRKSLCHSAQPTLPQRQKEKAIANAAKPSHIAGMTLLGELLTVIGPVGVLGLWLFQQTELERNAGELRKIAAARAVYQTY